MKIPAFLYGTYKEVKPKCRKIISRLKRGETWEEIFSKEQYLDTVTNLGLIVVDGPSPLVGGGTNFHCYVLHRELVISSHYGPDIPDHLYYSSLQSAWSLIAMISEQIGDYFYRKEDGIRFMNKERVLAFWDAQLFFWDEIQDVGERYWDASETTAWSLVSFFHSVLSSFEIQGIPIPFDGYLNYQQYYQQFLRNSRNTLISKVKLAEFIEVAKQGIDLMCDKNY